MTGKMGGDAWTSRVCEGSHSFWGHSLKLFSDEAIVLWFPVSSRNPQHQYIILKV